MAYTQINDYTAHSYTTGRDGADIKYIVIHHWGNTGGSAKNIVTNWFCRNAPTSAHYVVEDGTVYYIVSESDTAWHTGKWWYNTHSIGLECRTECTEGDIRTTAELVADIWKRLGRKVPVIGHKDIVSTACPGSYYNKIPTITAMAERIYNGQSADGVTAGWKQDDKGWWYVKPDGTIYASTWAEINGKYYLFNADGYMKTGWQQDSGKWYYLNTDGSMQKKWVSYQDKWYYLDEIEGDMTSDEFRKINGDWYRFNPDGTMAEKTTLKVGEDGKITD